MCRGHPWLIYIINNTHAYSVRVILYMQFSIFYNNTRISFQYFYSISDLESLCNFSSGSFPSLLPILCSSHFTLNKLVHLPMTYRCIMIKPWLFCPPNMILIFALVRHSFSWETVDCSGKIILRQRLHSEFRVFSCFFILYLFIISCD